MKRMIPIVMACVFAGCSAPKVPPMQPNPNLPLTAIPAEEGVGRLFFAATDPGVIYVYDEDTARILFFTPILKNQRFVLDPANRRATVEAKVVFEEPIDKKHTHRIYLDPRATPPKPEAPPAPIVVTPSTKPA